MSMFFLNTCMAWAQVRQPWADKDVAPAVLNDEQKAYLEQVAKEKAEKEEEEADKGPKVGCHTTPQHHY